MRDFPLVNSNFLAVALYMATTEHTKSPKFNDESWLIWTPLAGKHENVDNSNIPKSW